MRLSYTLGLILALIIASVATTYVAAQEPEPTLPPLDTPTATPPPQATDEPIMPLIVGGGPADPGEYPWMVALVDSSTANPRFGQFCGGSLIGAEWVLTAAHCVVSFGSVADPEDIDVVLGVNNLDEGPTSGSSGQRIGLTQVIPNPAYNEVSSDSDVALLHLSAPASLAPSAVGTLGLVGPGDGALVAPGTIATVTGWGVTSESGSSGSNALLEVDVPIVSNSTCNAPASYNGAVTENMLCAGFDEGEKDSCYGDSGGPLIVPDGGGGWLQAGVVSWGNGCARPDWYGVYSRVSQFKGWIGQYATDLGTPVYLPFLMSDFSDASSAGCTPDPAGESDNIADARIVCGGQTVSGQVSSPSDLDDVYKILVEPGQQLTISTTGNGGELDLFLYPPDTDDVVTDPWYTSSKNWGNSESIQVTIPVRGHWYIDVYAYSGTTDYDVTVSVSSP
jgi:secreted trypsin-like serine protease